MLPQSRRDHQPSWTVGHRNGRRRALLLGAGLLALQACSIAPQLAPTAAGCYAVHLDAFPAQFQEMLVPPPPGLVQLDTTLGGQLRVPAAWLESDGIGVRRASLTLVRPGWSLRDGVLVNDRAVPAPLPPDSLILNFGGAAATLVAVMKADTSGHWNGLAFVLSSATPHGQPQVPVRLERTACGPTRMAVSR